VLAYQTTRYQNPEDTAPVRQVRGKADAAMAVPARRALRVAKSVSHTPLDTQADRFAWRHVAQRSHLFQLAVSGGVHAF